MISSAHIGVGIIGREGLQASRISDYAIAQFSFLRRLLFVHGRECYRKNSFIILYNFYKNIIVISPLITFLYANKFQMDDLYNRFLYENYNILFTTVLLVWYAIADKEHSKKKLEQNGKFYIQGIHGECFNNWKIWNWILYGSIQGVLIIFGFIQSSPIISGEKRKLTNLGI